jgi:peptide methionine sulfoxide reductase MsrA
MKKEAIFAGGCFWVRSEYKVNCRKTREGALGYMELRKRLSRLFEVLRKISYNLNSSRREEKVCTIAS